MADPNSDLDLRGLLDDLQQGHEVAPDAARAVSAASAQPSKIRRPEPQNGQVRHWRATRPPPTALHPRSIRRQSPSRGPLPRARDLVARSDGHRYDRVAAILMRRTVAARAEKVTVRRPSQRPTTGGRLSRRPCSRLPASGAGAAQKSWTRAGASGHRIIDHLRRFLSPHEAPGAF